MVDDPRDALELFGSAPVDALVLGPHLVRRGGLFAAEAPDDVRHRPAVRRGGPHGGPRQPAPAARRTRASQRAGAGGGGGGRRPRRRRGAAGRRPSVALAFPVRVLRGHGHGPAAARNLGWRVTSASGSPSWTTTSSSRRRGARDLVADLGGVPGRRGGLPGAPGGAPAAWSPPHRLGAVDGRPGAGAMGHRRHGLPARRRWWRSHGFDERFPRAYREDADLALRVRDAGWTLHVGARTTRHPVRRRRRPGQPARAAWQRRRRVDAPAARPALA